MKTLNNYIIEKFKISNDIENTFDKYFIIGLPKRDATLFPESHLVFDGKDGARYLFTFDEIVKLTKKHEKYKGFYAFELADKFKDKIDDLKSKRIDIETPDVLTQGEGEFISKLIKDEKYK